MIAPSTAVPIVPPTCMAGAAHTEAMLAAFDGYADQLGPGLFGPRTAAR